MAFFKLEKTVSAVDNAKKPKKLKFFQVGVEMRGRSNCTSYVKDVLSCIL